MSTETPRRWFAFTAPERAQARRPLEGVTYRLSRADTPQGFWLTVDHRSDDIQITFEYAERDNEPTRIVSTQHLDFSTGVHSNRLFKLTIHNLRGLTSEARGGAPVDQIASRLRALVKREFDQVAGQEASPGVSLNREAASLGLRLEDQTPPWMVSALQCMTDRASDAP